MLFARTCDGVEALRHRFGRFSGQRQSSIDSAGRLACTPNQILFQRLDNPPLVPEVAKETEQSQPQTREADQNQDNGSGASKVLHVAASLPEPHSNRSVTFTAAPSWFRHSDSVPYHRPARRCSAEARASRSQRLVAERKSHRARRRLQTRATRKAGKPYRWAPIRAKGTEKTLPSGNWIQSKTP